ncbi:hypothetical protein JMG10_13230 [Nostoc ellipsosporum NOK]|nr:hypothetical protein [Nostoc ellipsosporum NOK]
MRSAIHFVGFRGDRRAGGNDYLAAFKVWGAPDFIHFRWDRRAKRELAPDDVVIFATGTEHDEPSRFNGPDIFEEHSV